jgi:hypothetical protein
MIVCRREDLMRKAAYYEESRIAILGLLVCGKAIDGVDDDDFDGAFGGDELDAEGFFEAVPREGTSLVTALESAADAAAVSGAKVRSSMLK